MERLPLAEDVFLVGAERGEGVAQHAHLPLLAHQRLAQRVCNENTRQPARQSSAKFTTSLRKTRFNIIPSWHEIGREGRNTIVTVKTTNLRLLQKLSS